MGPRGNLEVSVKTPSRRLSRIAAAALAIAAVFGASAAQAADTDTAEAEAEILIPLSISKDVDLDFGQIAGPTTAGTVILTPTPVETCSTTGGLLRVGNCQAAQFTGWGSPNQIIRINLPNLPITLTNTNPAYPGTTMQMTGRSIDGDPSLSYVSGNVNANGVVRYEIIEPSGVFGFRIGGTLSVGANQEPGVYQGTFTVTVSYQ